MNEFALYRRRNLLRTGEFAWQVDCRGKDLRFVWHANSYKNPMSLEEFARSAALQRTNDRITGSDILTTSPPAYVPDNHYIDESVSADELIKFWEAYQQALKEK